jgi:hypothetical protein
MQNGAYNMNQTIINTILPKLTKLIATANADIVNSVIDVYTGMGGIPAPKWQTEMPPKCVLNSTWPPCAWYCDKQSCSPGQCHPNDAGCQKLAEVVYDGWQGAKQTSQKMTVCKVTSTLGCFKDNTDVGGKRILPMLGGKLTVFTSMEACGAACHDSGSSDTSLIGVEFGGQCFCGDSFLVSNPTKAPDGDCQKMKCPGSTEGCGYNNRMLVYKADCKKEAPTPAPPTPPPTPNYMPCVPGSPGVEQ